MKPFLAIAAFMLFSSASSAENALYLQRLHIEASVPPASSFEAFLFRDLLAYFKQSGEPRATSVESRLLREGPTQSGVAYPEYYVWASVFSGSQLLQEGAVRLAAIEQTHFEVTDFISKSQIQSAPGEVGTVFSAALVPCVLSLAGAQ